MLLLVVKEIRLVYVPSHRLLRSGDNSSSSCGAFQRTPPLLTSIFTPIAIIGRINSIGSSLSVPLRKRVGGVQKKSSGSLGSGRGWTPRSHAIISTTTDCRRGECLRYIHTPGRRRRAPRMTHHSPGRRWRAARSEGWWSRGTTRGGHSPTTRKPSPRSSSSSYLTARHNGTRRSSWKHPPSTRSHLFVQPSLVIFEDVFAVFKTCREGIKVGGGGECKKMMVQREVPIHRTTDKSQSLHAKKQLKKYYNGK